jgi:uncharacterized protein (TIGR00369 family)
VPDDTPHDPLENETMRGFNVLLGYRLAEWREDFARLELALEAKHLNRSGVVHGGVLATMLDVASAMPASLPPSPVACGAR